MDYNPYQITEAVSWQDRAAHRIMELEGLNYSYKAIHQRQDYSTRPDGMITVSYKEPPKPNKPTTYTKGYGDNTAVPNEYGSELEAETNLKNRLVPEYVKHSKDLFNNYDMFSERLRIELLQSVFRGWNSPDTAKLINQGKFKEAAVEFLNNDEYNLALAKITKNWGIVPRMYSVYEALMAEEE